MANPEHLEILKQGVEAWNNWRRKNLKPDLSATDLLALRINGVNFSGTDLHGADLSHSEFVNTNFAYANLEGATLTNATFSVVSFIGANLRGANFGDAIITLTNLSDTQLNEADLSGATLYRVVFGANDLQKVRGLEKVRHHAPSTIGIDTIYRSHGNIPKEFLRGCGVPEELIVQIPALIAAMQPIQFYSCFISYSSNDVKFVNQLYADLQNEGVSCWFAPEDMKIGDKIRPRIDESIRLHDKLLLVLSENSVSSEWVGDEVEAALQKETEQEGKIVLFPIRLDDAVMHVKSDWPAKVRLRRHIGDFSDWKNHDSYRKGFERLMRDLKAEARRDV